VIETDIKKYIRMAFDTQDEGIVDRLSSKAGLETVLRGQSLLSEGELSKYLYILVDGIFHSCFTNQDGRTITDSFYWKQGMIIAGNSDLQQPSHSEVIALRNSRLISLPVSEITPLLEDNVAFMRFYIQKLNQSIRDRVIEKQICHFEIPINRYRWMKNNCPEWENLIPDKYIASFFLMTPVTYSRMKKKVREGNACKTPCVN